MKLEFSPELPHPPTAEVLHKEGKQEVRELKWDSTSRRDLERGSLTSLGLDSRKG